MNKIFTALLFLLFFFESFGAVTPGSIAFVQYNGDGTDNFAFVILKPDMVMGDKIRFTDNGWKSSGSFRANEGVIEWTAPSGLVSGTVVTIELNPASADIGSAVKVSSNNMSFSTGGDQVLAYTGTDASPTFIAALQMNGNWDGDATSSNTSAIPAGLSGTNFELAISPEQDNAAYNATVTSGTQEEIRDAISSLSPLNWDTHNSTNQTYSGAFVLPVEISSFSLKTVNRNTILSWTTESEINNDKFIIERSLDGRRYMQIGQEMGNGNTSVKKSYSFVDNSTQVGMNFYRLKQVDYNGEYEYSAILTAEISDGTISIYPTTTTSTVQLDLGAEKTATIVVYSVNGQIVSNQTVSVSNSEIDLSTLNAGIYYIKVETAGEVFTQQVIKQ